MKKISSVLFLVFMVLSWSLSSWSLSVSSGKNPDFKSSIKLENLIKKTQKDISSTKSRNQAAEKTLSFTKMVNKVGPLDVTDQTYSSVFKLQLVFQNIDKSFLSRKNCKENVEERRNSLLLSARGIVEDQETERYLDILRSVCSK